MAPWLIVVRKFAPYAAVVLVLIMAYQCGSNRASKKSAAKVAAAEAETAIEQRAREQCDARLSSLQSDLDAANARAMVDKEIYLAREQELQDIADEERLRLAGSYARALENAKAESRELRVRIAEMEPGEACLEVMREVAHGLD